MSAKRRNNRGRDLRHTETQAGVNVSRKVVGERGRTNGKESIAISGSKPGLRRRNPAEKRTLPFFAPNGELAGMVTYYPEGKGQ